MKNIFHFSLIFCIFILGCTKTNPTNNTNTPINPTNPTTPTTANNKFVSRSPTYKLPNKTVGQIVKNYFAPGFYVTDDTGKVKYDIIGPMTNGTQNWQGSQYRFNDANSIYFDYNNDGVLDMFSFVTNFVNAPWGSTGGKYLLVKDVLGKNPEKVYSNSTTRFAANFELNDLNGDGINEIIQYSQDGHQLADGTFGAESPLKIISFQPDGTFAVKEIGDPMGIHDMATGDIDNDGDVDLLVWRFNTKIGDSQPLLYLNDGKGNFTLTDSYTVFAGLKDIIAANTQYVITSVELFDLNNDGYLDIVTGQNIGQVKINVWEPYIIPNCRIYWGNAKGTFDFAKNYVDLPNTSIKDFSVANSVLGFSFIDFDKDGDYDVLASVTPDYGGYYLQLYENLGNGTFKDVTETKITGFSHIHPRNGGVDGNFTNFYNISLFDIDNDGDYDIIPMNIGAWTATSYHYPTNLYWENVGGSFFRRNM